jgi:DNA-binding NarL/FixJ family response regulator
MKARLPRENGLRKHRILIVEDHPVTREGFAHLINCQADLEVCGQADNAAGAVVQIAVQRPDLVIVDISLPDSNGIELIKDIRALHPALPMLVLSTHDEGLYAERAVRAGAQGYIMKQASTREVMDAIRMILRGEIYLSEAMKTRMVYRHLHGPASVHLTSLDDLTDRELEVFQLIGVGRTTRQIARSLHLSASTVETYRARIKEKLHIENATELVCRAVELRTVASRSS